jgi:hypothetical protein
MNPLLTPGRLLYLVYHLPVAETRRSIRQGGPWEQWRDRKGARAMERAAWQLPTPDFGPAPAFEVHLLTGRRFAFQSAFCLWSLAQAAQRNLAPVFHDDGTLTYSFGRRLIALFPRGRVVSREEMDSLLHDHLPAHRFPALRERFAHFPLIRKLIAPHLGSTGWKLVLDSDLLFFRRPDFLLQWLNGPNEPLHMADVADAYGYPPPLLEKLAGGPLPSRVNTGLCGLRGSELDWELLEAWCAHLLHAAGTHYLLEQALVALVLTGRSCAVAPAGDYITLPDRTEVEQPRAVLHHYVADSKRWYFRQAWREILALNKR